MSSIPTLYFKEESDISFFAPGLSFSVRFFPDTNHPISLGLIARSSVAFMVYINNANPFTVSPPRIQSTPKVLKLSEQIVSLVDIGIGPSFRFNYFDKFPIYWDFGPNITFMNAENFKRNDTLDYFGFGIFSNIASQLDISTQLYLEFGLNSIFNILSWQKGVYSPFGFKNNYEDKGKWDLISGAVFIHVGWRFK